MTDSAPKDATHYALATWVFLLDVAGIAPDDADLASAIAAITQADDEESGNAAGEALVGRVGAMLASDSPEDVAALAATLYGERAGSLGEGDRAERVHRIRKYQFENGRPWLARIWERTEAGEIAPLWLVIERVTDEVAAMDPNPWNDIDETQRIPVGDFQVLWELDACTSVAIL